MSATQMRTALLQNLSPFLSDLRAMQISSLKFAHGTSKLDIAEISSEKTDKR